MNITSVRIAARDIAQTELGSGFKELPFQFDVEANDDRHLAAGFCVLWDDGSQIDAVSQVVNIEQTIVLTITKRVFIRNDDAKIVDTVDSVYSALGSIIKRFVMDKMDLSGIVQKVELTSLGRPKTIGKEGRDIVALSCEFKVRYLIK